MCGYIWNIVFLTNLHSNTEGSFGFGLFSAGQAPRILARPWSIMPSCCDSTSLRIPSAPALLHTTHFSCFRRKSCSHHKKSLNTVVFCTLMNTSQNCSSVSNSLLLIATELAEWWLGCVSSEICEVPQHLLKLPFSTVQPTWRRTITANSVMSVNRWLFWLESCWVMGQREESSYLPREWGQLCFLYWLPCKDEASPVELREICSVFFLPNIVFIQVIFLTLYDILFSVILWSTLHS